MAVEIILFTQIIYKKSIECLTHRSQEHCEDRDTPDSFVPSSSPESVVGMEICRYPDLSLVKEEPPSPAVSPVIPMFPVFRGKGN